MAAVVYVHVGAPKTGTTYIQDRLASNKSRLAEHDVAYPVGLHGDMFRAALDLIDRPWDGQVDGFRGEWDALVRRTRRARSSAVISQEVLACATAQQVDRAVTDLAPAEVHVVFTARDIARQVPAAWQELLKHRRTVSYRRFLLGIRDPRSQGRIGREFWEVQGLPEVLERWGRSLTPDRVHVVTVPRPGARDGELWSRFCRAVNAEADWAPRDDARRNPSLGVAESAMLRKLNGRLRRAGVEGTDYRRVVREVMVHQVLATGAVHPRLTLPHDWFDWAEEIAESWRSWIRASGVEVIGDLDDLLPVPPDPDATWVDPDRVRPRDVADAALSALTAMVEEAARRSDPDERLRAKAAKATRRLRER
ncbi:hypothetical protein GON03_18175 [Nocardioides sp. MAH-18]|uniref:Sulfotransferase family protein n=1 Tax=Nocardioides agri TaxID=2682843 RepID=A0A6L6XWC3_9ACTN|nr:MULTISPECIES: hypothetical protein [unclassified Nocardioides]MBA2956269.1 hypothetical protein [Nocardioides sp. CGMCC 1.13656]MVQ51112.1 hypothetical protein [Nocardioides sp. MAH-18]